jgi:hypothetical protein
LSRMDEACVQYDFYTFHVASHIQRIRFEEQKHFISHFACDTAVIQEPS